MPTGGWGWGRKSVFPLRFVFAALENGAGGRRERADRGAAGGECERERPSSLGDYSSKNGLLCVALVGVCAVFVHFVSGLWGRSFPRAQHGRQRFLLLLLRPGRGCVQKCRSSSHGKKELRK